MTHDETTTSESNFFVKVYRFYRDGFRSMTVGRTLWAIIGIKLVVFFLILRWIFFPDFLSSKADDDQGKAAYVREQLVTRGNEVNKSTSQRVNENEVKESRGQEVKESGRDASSVVNDPNDLKDPKNPQN